VPIADPKMFRVKDARFVASSPDGNLPPPVGVEIAFAGRSNVGKSTLLNALMGRKGLARTSSTPGCTRAVTLFEVELGDGARVTLGDLPGYGYAKRSKAERARWAPLMDDYLLGRATLRAVVLLVDVRRGVEEDDRGLLELIGKPARVSRPALAQVVVATKVDKVGAAGRKLTLAKMRASAGIPVFGFSLDDPEAPERLWQALRLRTGLDVAAAAIESTRAIDPH
jgi:GTP-binding protein